MVFAKMIVQGVHDINENSDVTATNKKKINKRKVDWKRALRMKQMNTEFSIKKAPFLRVVQDILQEIEKDKEVKHRIHKKALEALHEASEGYLVKLFTRANHCTIHRGKKTLLVKDFELVKKIRDDDNFIL
jgi:histone H3/H4